MVEQILEELKDLDKELFDVHTIDQAWFSTKSITRAFGNTFGEELVKLPDVRCVRIETVKRGGILELHEENGKIKVLCYCCFGGNFDHGIVDLNGLKAKVESMVDHHCPPWGA